MTDEQRTKLRRELGWLGHFFLWLMGRPLREPAARAQQDGVLYLTAPVYLWRVDVCHYTSAYMRYAPNAFHRGMQRLAFGVRWHCEV